MNDDFELPNLKKNEEETIEQPVSNNENQVLEEKIEIPQEYYDKLNKEKEERLQALAKKEEEHDINVQKGSTILLIILSLLVCGGLLYGMNNYNNMLIIGLPLYVILGSIISGYNKKEDSKFGVSVLISCMGGALVCFILAMQDKTKADNIIYYAYAFFVVAFVGYILSIVIIKLLYNKEVKALGKIFYLAIIVGIFVIPYYFYTNKKSEFMNTVFLIKPGIITAPTEKDYIENVLEYRYGYKFVCEDKKKNYIDDLTHRRLSIRQCNGIDDNTKVEVMSLFYDEDKNQFIIRDSYLDNAYINPLKNELEDSIKKALLATSVNVGLYPDKACYFIGDCKNDSNYEKEIEIDNLHKYSDSLKLQDYVGINSVDFFNKYTFNYDIVVRGNYSTDELFNEKIDSIVNILQQKGLKNKKGFTITFKDTTIKSDVYKVVGKSTGNENFSNYQVVED